MAKDFYEIKTGTLINLENLTNVEYVSKSQGYEVAIEWDNGNSEVFYPLTLQNVNDLKALLVQGAQLNPLASTIQTSTAINCKVVANTIVFTNNSALNFYCTGFVAQARNVSAVVAQPTAALTSDGDTISSNAVLGLTANTKYNQVLPDNNAKIVAPTKTIVLAVSVGANAANYTIDADVIGYYK